MAVLFVIASAVVLVVGRFLITPRLDVPTMVGCYEAFAHLFVGGLFGVWFNRKGTRAEAICPIGFDCLVLAIALSLFELVMFLIQKFGG